jgi:hypothetical protein
LILKRAALAFAGAPRPYGPAPEVKLRRPDQHLAAASLADLQQAIH